MATVSQIKQAGSTLTLKDKALYEPLDAPFTLDAVLSRFGDHYDVSKNSHLYRFLLALCGDAGAGAIKKELFMGRLQTNLESTHFNNLDKLYGNPLGLTRLSEEIYDLDPTSEVMTKDQREEVLSKDAAYRARCLKWMRAIALGPSLDGLKLAAEAALGYECDIVERYNYLENLRSDRPLPMENIGDTNSPTEFVIVARTPEVTEAERRRAVRLLDRLKPTGTIPTIVGGDFIRIEHPIQDVAATSERFELVRYVTGRSDIPWPDIEPAQGYWIEQNIEHQAPGLAFLDRQEAITYLSVINITASSEHIGNFNKEQRTIFPHLNATDAGVYVYGADQALAQPFAPIFATAGWTGGAARDLIMVNNYYPLDYFTLQDFTADFTPSSIFWSSVEAKPPAQEELIVDLGSSRPINYIEFELAGKPIDFIIEYDLGNGTWAAVNPKPNQPAMSSSYISAQQSAWQKFHTTFDLIAARRLRITFTRRSQPFPFDTSEIFDWSVDVRNLRLAHAVSSLDDIVQHVEATAVDDLPTTGGQVGRYVYLNRESGGWPGGTALQWTGTVWNKVYYTDIIRGVNTHTLFVPFLDQGTDILGNTYRNDLEINLADNVLDEDESSFWLSQPNPSPTAVEALYFDLRFGWVEVTMGYLDQFFMSNLDGMSMRDMEFHATDGVVLDEIYIDPLTLGPHLHIYYSTDANANWEEKMWTPVPNTFILQRGTYALDKPTYVKFIKLEFTNLTPVPYLPVDFPALEPVTFRRYPTWVQQFFYGLNYTGINALLNNVQKVNLDPLSMGFINASDKLDASYATIRTELELGQDLGLKGFVGDLMKSKDSELTDRIESQIDFRSPVMWQRNLPSELTDDRAESRFVKRASSGVSGESWAAEQSLPVSQTPQLQSGDLTQSMKEKMAPDMWFPITCRHAYQVVESDRPSKVAYQVGIKEIVFYRRDYTVAHDETVYYETLGDDVHTQVNEFVQADWRWVVEE